MLRSYGNTFSRIRCAAPYLQAEDICKHVWWFRQSGWLATFAHPYLFEAECRWWTKRDGRCVVIFSWTQSKTDMEDKKLLNKVIHLDFFVHKKYSDSTMVEPLMSLTSLMRSLLHFWALNVSVALLSIEGRKALGFHHKYLNLCSEDERGSYRFRTTWGWVIKKKRLTL